MKFEDVKEVLDSAFAWKEATRRDSGDAELDAGNALYDSVLFLIQQEIDQDPKLDALVQEHLTKEQVAEEEDLSSEGSSIKFVIPAKAYSDDRVFQANFDATLWFIQANDDEILALAQCDWGTDYAADAVAQFMDADVEDLDRMFHYLQLKSEIGFECEVDGTKAMLWLAQHKPHLHAAIQSEENK